MSPYEKSMLYWITALIKAVSEGSLLQALVATSQMDILIHREDEQRARINAIDTMSIDDD